MALNARTTGGRRNLTLRCYLSLQQLSFIRTWPNFSTQGAEYDAETVGLAFPKEDFDAIKLTSINQQCRHKFDIFIHGQILIQRAPDVMCSRKLLD